ncbi:hypothetical protein Pmani_032230 [Petrolisthes manimaculis]|uniref:Tetraspanin n=1 Tax=Petrolisthes manimaculis TaxID=1843537 RepID=A0AAE1NT07_9EUCA|nr:hypothetical protein Pmani_032230 [Petrolisthes manimaculis]
MAVAKYIAFATFIVLAGTGIAVVYTGCSLLTAYVAYLSPWLPAWVWVVVSAVMALGVGITATSTAGAISVLAPNRHAFKLCLSLLLVAVLTELSATLLVYQKQQLLGQALTSFMRHRMVVTQSDYGTNISDTQLWDEIQLEKNCCGTDDFKDWFATTYGNGTNVPDSCCLIVETGCGRDISKSADPTDDIITEGCLPTVVQALKLDYSTLSRGVWLPVIAMHVALLLLLVATSIFMQERMKGVGSRVFSVSAVLPITHSHKYASLHDDY